MRISTLAGINLAAYAVHDLTFFFFLCFLPFGKHFHVITSLFNVFFMRVRTGNVKPVVHGISDAQLDDLQVVRREEIRGLHLEAHAGLLQLCRLRPLLGPLSRQRRRKAPLPAVHQHQGARLRIRALPDLRQTQDRSRSSHRRHLQRGRDLVVHHLRRLRGGMPRRHRVHRQDGGPAAGHGRRGHGAAVAPEADERPREARQSLGQDGEEARRMDRGRGRRRGGEARREGRHRRDALLRRQHHLLRRPHAEDRAGHGPDPRQRRRGLRGDRQGREGQRPRRPALRRGDALPEPEGTEHGSHQGIGSEAGSSSTIPTR